MQRAIVCGTDYCSPGDGAGWWTMIFVSIRFVIEGQLGT
jgi:hypothetical protein